MGIISFVLLRKSVFVSFHRQKYNGVPYSFPYVVDQRNKSLLNGSPGPACALWAARWLRSVSPTFGTCRCLSVWWLPCLLPPLCFPSSFQAGDAFGAPSLPAAALARRRPRFLGAGLVRGEGRRAEAPAGRRGEGRRQRPPRRWRDAGRGGGGGAWRAGPAPLRAVGLAGSAFIPFVRFFL